MPLLGAAAVAMWWDIAPAQREEFEDWHSHEHFPERMSIFGFRRGSRFRSPSGENIFVIYELDAYETLTSPQYLARLNAPTPWSTKMMPHHRNMVRSQCRVTASFGGGIAQSLVTLRFSPEAGREEDLSGHLSPVLARLSTLPGITAAHLLRTDAPATTLTHEQRIRGGDAHADWITLVGGYDANAVVRAASTEFNDARLAGFGAQSNVVRNVFALVHTVTPADN